jgi:hypothetical protein
MNPPSVYELTIPKAHRINSKTAIVQSIEISFSNHGDQRVTNRRKLKYEAARSNLLSRQHPPNSLWA